MEAPRLRNIVLKTVFSTMICCSIVSLLWLEFVEISDRGRRSDFYGLGHVLLVFCAICMALSTFAIYFNRFSAVRTNVFLSWLSFFLPPVLVAIFLETGIFEGEALRLFAVMLLSFLTPLTCYFLQYRRQLRDQSS